MDKILILLTDDDDDDRLFMRRAIESHIRKAVIYEAEDGVDALRQLEEQADRPSFNLVLLDINMPLMNGFEVLDKIRSLPALRHTPIVMLSTSDHPDEISKAYKKGVNAYIKKPTSYTDYDGLARAIETCFLQVMPR